MIASTNARRQTFSGSHAFNDDKPQHGHTISSTQFSIVRDSNNEGNASISVLSACPLTNVSETKGWGIQSCGQACLRDTDCPVEKGYSCSCDGPCGLTCNKVHDGNCLSKIASFLCLIKFHNNIEMKWKHLLHI